MDDETFSDLVDEDIGARQETRRKRRKVIEDDMRERGLFQDFAPEVMAGILLQVPPADFFITCDVLTSELKLTRRWFLAGNICKIAAAHMDSYFKQWMPLHVAGLSQMPDARLIPWTMNTIGEIQARSAEVNAIRGTESYHQWLIYAVKYRITMNVNRTKFWNDMMEWVAEDERRHFVNAMIDNHLVSLDVVYSTKDGLARMLEPVQEAISRLAAPDDRAARDTIVYTQSRKYATAWMSKNLPSLIGWVPLLDVMVMDWRAGNDPRVREAFNLPRGTNWEYSMQNIRRIQRQIQTFYSPPRQIVRDADDEDQEGGVRQDPWWGPYFAHVTEYINCRHALYISYLPNLTGLVKKKHSAMEPWSAKKLADSIRLAFVLFDQRNGTGTLANEHHADFGANPGEWPDPVPQFRDDWDPRTAPVGNWDRWHNEDPEGPIVIWDWYMAHVQTESLWPIRDDPGSWFAHLDPRNRDVYKPEANEMPRAWGWGMDYLLFDGIVSRFGGEFKTSGDAIRFLRDAGELPV